jgi:hypothetical protein
MCSGWFLNNVCKLTWYVCTRSGSSQVLTISTIHVYAELTTVLQIIVKVLRLLVNLQMYNFQANSLFNKA